ncbi:MAG TPA: uroporphyrinogen-III C-methyltransferase [Solirubrobacteraceae bacterium]|jgi:uroporphyrinogen III methyltransferase/synthase|nr:uroporphyrinogen-III C-methyltransferase [Solirubrobacteraceae bacterium]
MTGRVALIGAGPGDPGLLTARALELIASADVILYDRLIPAAALQSARPHAELRFVGKEGGGASVPQEQTEELMLERARAGKTVVRLKGGDPFVFGRGGEEAQRLKAAGIAFEIVPGITAGVAAPAYAGIPVTHREHASAVALVTGHEDPTKPETVLDYAGLAGFPGTLVFYMGVGRLGQIAQALIDAGRDPREPAAVVERGTLPGQRTVVGTLADIADRAAEAQVEPPSITLVGAVASLAEELAWRHPGPLAGRRVAVTRARAQSSGLADRLAALGAEVIQAPAIRIEPLRPAIPPLDGVDLVCLTSPNGAQLLIEGLLADGRDTRALAGATVAAIGPGTARALAEHGIRADIVPERFVAEGLVEALAATPVSRALIARALQARDVLPAALRERGAQVQDLALYRTVAEPLAPETLASALNADWLTFTSSSTVRFLAQSAGGPLRPRARVVSIGPATSATLREHGLEPDVEAARHDIDGLVEALLADSD